MDPVKRRHRWWKKMWVTPIERWLFGRADRVVATCDDEVEWVRKFELKVKKVEMLSLGDGALDMPLKSVHNPLRLLFIGRLHPLKGVEFLLEAMRCFLTQRRGGTETQRLELKVIGKDEGEGGKLRQMAKEHELNVKFCGVVSEEEKEKALAVLLDEIHKQDDHMAVGVLGGRVLFRVLCDYGYEDLATKMITRLDPPSYGVMIADGLTTLAENVREPYGSCNHHFWGDISALMIEYFAGIRVNPNLQSAGNIDIRPVFSTDMQHAKAYYNATVGRVEVAWEREGESVRLRLIYPEGAQGFVVAPLGYTVNGEEKVKATSGTFQFFKK
jgi:hypothetical protein